MKRRGVVPANKTVVKRFGATYVALPGLAIVAGHFVASPPILEGIGLPPSYFGSGRCEIILPPFWEYSYCRDYDGRRDTDSSYVGKDSEHEFAAIMSLGLQKVVLVCTDPRAMFATKWIELLPETTQDEPET